MDCKYKKRIDLHIHSTASDGSSTPREILDMARKTGISAISITDHDTIDGVLCALEEVAFYPVEFITGVEISADPPEGIECTGSFHILGYGFDPSSRDLQTGLARLKSARSGRNPKILEKLSALGVEISMDEVMEMAGGGQVGRPHIAQVMVKRGFVSSIDEAFDRYIGKGGPAYVDKFRLSTKEAISMIQEAGGEAVLAHPGLVSFSGTSGIEDLLSVMKGMGLFGLEAFYSEHTEDQRLFYDSLAAQYDLIVTGGSDFHGRLKPGIRIGYGKGDLFVPYDLFVKLKESLL